MNFDLEGKNSGFAFAISAAIISGVSVFLNKSAVASFNPFEFTGMKNLVVALLMLAGLLLCARGTELRSLSRKDWRNLVLIGLVGGSVPFLLFFWGLSHANAADASLLQKSLFIPAGALAFVFLKERLSFKQLAATGLLFIGATLFSGLDFAALGTPEYAILAAVLLWSVEDVISKRVLSSLSPAVVVFGRMFFGSLAIFAFLGATGQVPDVIAFSANQWLWLSLTSLFLLGYNWAFYSGLQKLKVGETTGILLLGSVVTTALSFSAGTAPKPLELLGAVAVLAGVGAIVAFAKTEKSELRSPAPA